MRLPLYKKEKAIKLRKVGYSLNEISDKLSIAKSTASLWLGKIILSKKALMRLLEREAKGRAKAQLTKVARRKILQEIADKKANKLLSPNLFNKGYSKIYCALFYWCEGSKDNRSVTFTNSDSKMISIFLELFRKSFALNESKFRVCVHLHSYHSTARQLKYWSKVTHIPLKQFIKPYQKENTGKRIRAGYQGCIAVSYHDVNVAREIRAVINMFINKMGP